MLGVDSASTNAEFLLDWSSRTYAAAVLCACIRVVHHTVQAPPVCLSPCCSGWDYVGIVPRVVRANVFPLAALFFLIILAFFLKTVGGSMVGSLLVKILCMCRKHKIKQSRKWTSAFTAEFAKLLDGEKSAVYSIRSKLDKYSAFQRGYRKLTKLEFTQGWRIEDRDGLPVLRKVWTVSREYDNDLFGRSHVKGDYKRTWEVVNDAGIHTYAMHANPEYLVRDAHPGCSVLLCSALCCAPAAAASRASCVSPP